MQICQNGPLDKFIQFLSHAQVQGVKRSVLSVSCLSLSQKLPDHYIYASERLVSTKNLLKLAKNWLHHASNLLARPTSVTNTKQHLVMHREQQQQTRAL